MFFCSLLFLFCEYLEPCFIPWLLMTESSQVSSHICTLALISDKFLHFFKRSLSVKLILIDKRAIVRMRHF